MTDDQPEDGLTPDQTEAVRSLLRSLRVQGPIPPEVAARLDATLESLEAERNPGASRGGGHVRADGVFVDPDPTTIGRLPDAPDPPDQAAPPPGPTPTAERPRATPTAPGRPDAPPAEPWGTAQPASAYPVAGGPPAGPGQPPAEVVDLAARRRRRRAGIGLLAAAAAVVAAVGVGQLVGNDNPTTDAGNEPSSSEPTPGEASDVVPTLPAVPTGGPQGEPLPSVGPATFRADVERVWPALAEMDPDSTGALLTGCTPPAGTDYAFPVTTPDSSMVHALYADRIGPGQYRVSLYDCTDSAELASAEFDLPDQPR